MDIQKLLRNKTILAIASIVTGIVLMVFQRTVPITLIRIVGYILLVTAGGYLVTYFFGPAVRRDQIQLGYAVVSAVCGLLMIMLAGSIVNLLPKLLGVVLIVNGASNLMAVRSSSLQDKMGPFVIIALGIFFVLFSGVIANIVILLIGIAFVLNGLAELNLIRKIW